MYEEEVFALGKTIAFLKLPFTENSLFLFLHCVKPMLEHSHKIQKGWIKNSPYQQYNDHKPNTNLDLFVLTQPICITLRFFTASSAQYCFSCKTWRNPITENWGNRIIYSNMHKSFWGQEDVTLVMMLSLVHLSPRGTVVSFARTLPCQKSAL